MMKNLGTQTIETERLILRKINLNDVSSMYNNWATDSKTTYTVMWDVHKSIDDTINLINMWIKEYELEHTYRWVVELKDNKQIIGTIDLVNKSIRHERCEIGYCYGSKWWNKGYATEALKAVIDYLKNKVGFKVICAEHLPSNPASGRVMEKSGMTMEAVLKNRYINKNTLKHEDAIVYSIIIED